MQSHIETIEAMIYTIRGQRVMIDKDLANLYGVETKALNQAVKRNLKRFPDDFMFQLTLEEFRFLKSQIVTSKLEVEVNRSNHLFLRKMEWLCSQEFFKVTGP